MWKPVVVNAVNKTNDDFTTTYDMADGDTEFVIPISQRCSINVDVVAGSFDYPVGTSNGTNLDDTDATVGFTQSADGVNDQTVDGATTLTLDAVQKLGGWEEDVFEAGFVHFPITVNSVTAGTVRILLTLKPVD